MKQLLVIFFLFLSLLCGCTTDADRSRMRSGLDSINQRNRNDQSFTIADVQPYADFFDRHGTSNDRLLAHYLLGRAYYDAGEAPMALQCYQQAIECADTTAKDCDFAQLSRVYGQMGDVFYEQNLYSEQLIAFEDATRYAWHGNDTLSALMFYVQRAYAFEGMQLVDSAIIVLKQSETMFCRHGYCSYAALLYGTLFEMALGKGSVEKARMYMEKYETQSGLFDNQGNIESGREIYYYHKGMLFLKELRLDSAEHYFRKELHNAKDFNNQNAGSFGLAMLYEHRQMPDSSMKYYKYSRAINDSMYLSTETGAIERIHSMYNYTRNQEKARKAEHEIMKVKEKWHQVIIAISIVVVVLITVLLNMYSKRREAETNYKNSLRIIEMAQSDLLTLSTNESAYRELIAEKERIIHEQKNQLQSFHHYRSLSSAETLLSRCKDYAKIELLRNRGGLLTEDEWRMIRKVVIDVFPGYYDFLLSKQHLLTDNEFQTCLLLRIHFQPSVICSILGKSRPTITKMRIKLLKKLFDEDGSSQNFDDKILKIC